MGALTLLQLRTQLHKVYYTTYYYITKVFVPCRFAAISIYV
jgi:hypothetical protein